VRYAALHGVLQESESPEMETLWNRIKDNQDYYLMEDEVDGIIKAHEDSNYAFLLEESYFTSLRTRNSSVKDLICDFVRAEEYFFTSIYALPFQKGSPYLKRMSVGYVGLLLLRINRDQTSRVLFPGRNPPILCISESDMS
jgi:hypothetical protein